MVLSVTYKHTHLRLAESTLTIDLDKDFAGFLGNWLRSQRILQDDIDFILELTRHPVLQHARHVDLELQDGWLIRLKDVTALPQ